MVRNKTVLQKALEALDRQVDDEVILDEDHDVDERQQIMYAFRNSPEEIIFEGDDTEACRQQCLSNLIEAGYFREAVRELMVFSRRSRRAVCRWLRGEVIPQRADWLRWQYWLRAKGYRTRELDHMPNSFFQLRKHIICGDISFAEAAHQLGIGQNILWAFLNNEVNDRYQVVRTVGNIHALVAAINRRISEREIVAYLEVDLDPDGDLSEVKKRYGIGQQKRVRPDEAHKLIPRR